MILYIDLPFIALIRRAVEFPFFAVIYTHRQENTSACAEKPERQKRQGLQLNAAHRPRKKAWSRNQDLCEKLGLMYTESKYHLFIIATCKYKIPDANLAVPYS